MMCHKWFKLIFLSLLILNTVLIIIEIIKLFNFSEPAKCFYNQSSSTSSSLNSAYKQLDDVLLANEQPCSGCSIFFIDTKCTHSPQSFNQYLKNKLISAGINIANLTARQACAVESAALHNPNFTVFVLYARPTYFDQQQGGSNSVMDAILTYPNVHFRTLNVWSYAVGTPAQEWFLEGHLFKSRYIVEHMSDYLRLLTLWRWGGLYLDLDVITLQSMENLPPNYAGAESDYYLGNSVMNFEPTGFGHEVVTICLRDFQENYNGKEWAFNGPVSISRVIGHICGTHDTRTMVHATKYCHGFKVFGQNAFFAIPWHHLKYFFDPENLEKVMERLQFSYVTHMWNSASRRVDFKVGNGCAYDKLAKLNCPRVYAAVGKDMYF